MDTFKFNALEIALIESNKELRKKIKEFRAENQALREEIEILERREL